MKWASKVAIENQRQIFWLKHMYHQDIYKPFTKSKKPVLTCNLFQMTSILSLIFQ